MGKFGDIYNRLLNELVPAALVAPALPAVKAAGSAAIMRGLAALGGGLATTMSNKTANATKTKTSTKRKSKESELTPTSSKSLPGTEGPIIQSKFNECYNNLMNEIMIDPGGLAVSPKVGSKAGGGGSLWASPRSGGMAGSGLGLRITPGGSGSLPSTQISRSGSFNLPTPSTTSGATYRPALKGVGRLSPTGPTDQTTQVLKAADKAVSNVVPAIAAATGVLGAAAAGGQPDLEPGALVITPGTAPTTNAQAQGLNQTIDITPALGATLAVAPASVRSQTQTRTRQRRGDSGLTPTSSKALPGVEGPIVQDKFIIP